MSDEISYIPTTPGGSVLMHLESETEQEAWDKLLQEASHMPYRNKQDLIDRGYEVGIAYPAVESDYDLD